MSADNSKKYSIQTAAQMAGLSAHTIRAWEKRYKALTPSRAENGRRLYSAEEVDRLILLSQLTHLGSNIGQIAQFADEDLRSMYSKMVQGGDLFAATMVKRDINLQEMKEQLMQSVEKYEVSTISQLLSQAKNAVEPKVFALEILKPLVEEVRQKQLHTAQMQALFAIVRFHAGNIIYSHFEKAQKSSHKFVLTGFEQENHSFNLLITALLCCQHKKHFYYLNTNLPVPSVIDAVKAVDGTNLVISIPDGDFEKNIEFIDEVAQQLSGKVKIWVVGKNVKEKWNNVVAIRDTEKLDELLAQSV